MNNLNDGIWRGEGIDGTVNLLSVLSRWESLAYDETRGFCKRFCPNAWILVQVSWDSENMRFVYILDSGRHIADSVKITEWLEFLLENDEVSHRDPTNKLINTQKNSERDSVESTDKSKRQ